MIPTPAPEPTDATTAFLPGEEPAPKTLTTTTPFRPRSNRILIKPDKISRMVGSIRAPDQVFDKGLDGGRHWSGLTCRTATVISVGPGMRTTYEPWIGHRDEEGVARWPMHGIRPGMRILYRAWSGHDIVVDGEEYQVILSTLVDAEILEDGRLDLIEDRLLVRRRNPLLRSRGGIWLPEIAVKTPLEGEVTQIGSGKIVTNGSMIPLDVRPGDRVAWRPMKGVDVSKHVPGESESEIILLFEADLVGVIEGDEHFEPVASPNREQ